MSLTLLQVPLQAVSDARTIVPARGAKFVLPQVLIASVMVEPSMMDTKAALTSNKPRCSVEL
ncbi:hypothetical protein NOVOSPHI9U_310060 [Novosphingobium sp. 9U]|nr:hypothetical protein NOVOSPHI9U_310060 [Novosphingobium sp. 9U]